jgi:hypothetical protein
MCFSQTHACTAAGTRPSRQLGCNAPLLKPQLPQHPPVQQHRTAPPALNLRRSKASALSPPLLLLVCTTTPASRPHTASTPCCCCCPEFWQRVEAAAAWLCGKVGLEPLQALAVLQFQQKCTTSSRSECGTKKSHKAVFWGVLELREAELFGHKAAAALLQVNCRNTWLQQKDEQGPSCTPPAAAPAGGAGSRA